jgi:protein archease
MSAIEWLDHTADIGFRATGASIEAAFCEAGKALFSLMFDIGTIEESAEYSFELSADTCEGLLADWLSELLAQKDLTRLIFSRFEVAISRSEASGFLAKGRAFGERLDRVKHQAGTEIKGISYLGLEVVCQDAACTAQVLVDV